MLVKFAFILITLLSAEKCTSAEKEKSAESSVHDSLKIDDSQNENSQNITRKGEIIYLKEGENKFLKEFNMNVTFKKMLEDSRCPKDVQCIWEGNAKAEIEFMGIYTRPVLLQFSTVNDTKRGFINSHEFNGLSISLIEVTPEPTSKKGFSALKGSYNIKLKIMKPTDFAKNESTMK